MKPAASGLRSLAAALLMAAGSAQAVTIDFDALTAGDVVTSVGGVGFSSNIAGYDLVVSDLHETTSGANSLGVDDGGTELFLKFDEVVLSFPDLVSSVSVSFVSVPGTDGTYSIDTASGSIVGALPASTVLGGGSEVFTLTFASAVPFASATLGGPLAGVPSWNIDDIVFEFAGVSEPAAAALAALGLLMLAGSRRRRSGPGDERRRVHEV